MGIVKFSHSTVLDDIIDASKEHDVIILEGGGRSTKTYSWIQFCILITFAQTNKMEGLERFYRPEKPHIFTISRSKLTWLKTTALKDFIDICTEYKLPVTPEFNVNRPDQIYFLNGSEFAFIGLDEPLKLHGRKQDIFVMNEAMDTKHADFLHFMIRTDVMGILDYNPSALDHWIYDKVENREDAILLNSTMLDNPFLPDRICKEILSLEPTPENIERGTADKTNWEIYGLGKRAALKGLIYKNWGVVKRFPENCEWVIYGQDWGYTNDVAALVKIGLKEGELYIEELIYQTNQTNLDLSKGYERHGLRKGYDEIYAGFDEPKSIEELFRLGWNIQTAPAGPDSVIFGIDIMKRYRQNIVEGSLNTIKEIRGYKWQENKAGETINKPVKHKDHSMDAVRGAVVTKLSIPQTSYFTYKQRTNR